MVNRPCWCIPNRAATIVVSLLSIFLSAFFLFAAVLITLGNALTPALIIPTVVWAVGFALLFVGSWVGFIGSIRRKRRAVAFYAFILMIIWAVTFIGGLYNIMVLFMLKQDVADGCMRLTEQFGGISDLNIDEKRPYIEECHRARDALAVVVTVVWVSYQLLALWIMFTVFALRRELIDKAVADKRAMEESYITGPGNNFGGGYLQRSNTQHSSSSSNSEESKMYTRSGQVVISVP